MKNLLFIDNHILALNKPSGLLSHPNGTKDLTLQGNAKDWIKNKFKKPGNVFLHPIHRLDRPVSGVVIFARTDKSLSRLNAFQRTGSFKKKYLALVEGHFRCDEALLEHELIKESYHTREASVGEKNAKKATLYYRVLKKFSSLSLLEIHLMTGRYHQIRFQLAQEGHPILGDKKYGSTNPTESFFLHHIVCQFPHPISREMIAIEAPLPKIWASFL